MKVCAEHFCGILYKHCNKVIKNAENVLKFLRYFENIPKILFSLFNRKIKKMFHSDGYLQLFCNVTHCAVKLDCKADEENLAYIHFTYHVLQPVQ